MSEPVSKPEPVASSGEAPASPAPRKRSVAKAATPPADPEVAAAERLARISVSDIILYNEEKFAEGVAAGNVVAALESQLKEASASTPKEQSPR